VPGIVDRGLRQVGSLGPGNHFLEVQAVEEIYDATTAQRFGLMTRRRGPVAGCSQRSVCPEDTTGGQPRACLHDLSCLVVIVRQKGTKDVSARKAPAGIRPFQAKADPAHGGWGRKERLRERPPAAGLRKGPRQGTRS